MASTYVNDLRLEEIGSGEQSTTWGTTTNTNLELIAEAFGYATEAITEDADTFSTTIADGATEPGRALYLKYTGTLDSVCTVSLLPNTVCKLWIIENATTGGYNISMKQGSGSEVVVPNGHVKVIYTDGNSSSAAVTDAFIDLNLNNLIIKNPATSSSPATLLLQTGDTDVAVNDVLGKLQFQAPDEGTGTDAILVAAEVAAVSEGDFSSSSNATKLSFRTGASEAATTAATEKMAISSVGNVTIKNTATGDDTPVTLLLRTGETDIAASDVLGKIQFQAPDEGTGGDAQMIAAEVAAVSEGDFSSTSNATKLSFKTGASEAATEKMSISSVGNVTIKNTATGDDTPVTLLLQTGETAITANDVLGKIQFQAPDEAGGTDAILVSAEVAAVAEGTFEADNNATKLSFKTGASEAATEKMSLSSGGDLSVSNDVKLASDAAVLGFGADNDVTLTHVADTGLLLNSTRQLQFNDASQNITAPNATTLDINATDEVEINATNIDLNGSVDLNTVSAVQTYKAGQSFFQGRTAANVYYETDSRGFYAYYNADNYTRMLAFNAAGGDPVWQSRSGGGTIRSEIESSGDFLSATNSYASTSDARLKEHITDSGSQWNDIKAMRVRKYSFKEEKVDAPNMIGVIAQELESAGMGKLVKTHLESNPANDGGDEVPVLDSSGNQKSFKSVKYSVIHMKALKALQEAMDRIEALEAKVASLGG